MKKKSKYCAGFTLAEIMVVLAVMTIVGIIVIETFVRSLRGGSKSEAVALLKQNGQQLMEALDKNVRNSDAIICPVFPTGTQTATSDLLAVTNGGIFTRYRFKSATNNTNGQIIEDHPIRGERVSFSEFLTDLCTNTDYPGATPSILTDTSNVSIFIPQSKNLFKRGGKIGYKDIVTIYFEIKPGLSTPKIASDQIDSIPLTTAIELR